MRHPDRAFLYDREFRDRQTQGYINQLVAAISRGAKPHYVQDALRAEGAVARLICDGAWVMVKAGGGDAVTGVGLWARCRSARSYPRRDDGAARACAQGA